MDDEFDHRDWKLTAQPVVRLLSEECSRCVSFIIQSGLRVASQTSTPGYSPRVRQSVTMVVIHNYGDAD